jgi:Bifunctional DNA primase/polymerase, N-terminal/Primase C terminal 2 (PriCT-2)
VHNTLPPAPSQSDPFALFAEQEAQDCGGAPESWPRAEWITPGESNVIHLRLQRTAPVMLESALALVSKYGWKIFPVRIEELPGGRSKKYSWLSAKYAPGGENWGMTDDPKRIKNNFSNPRWRTKCGIGVPTGSVNGIVVVEADTMKGHGVDGIGNLHRLEAKHGKLPHTLMAVSPTGSPHRYFRPPAGMVIKSSNGVIAEGVDVKAQDAMVVAPPTVRQGVGDYRWLNDAPIADMPAWLIELVRVDAPTDERVTRSTRTNEPFGQFGYDEQFGASIDQVERALNVIPRNETDSYAPGYWEALLEGKNRYQPGREYMVAVGMATHAATGGSTDGLALFNLWRSGAPDYFDNMVTEKWRGFRPTSIGFGTLKYLADLACPGWDTPQMSIVGTQQNDDTRRDWPVLASEALYGLPGEMVALYEPHTEADPVALLVQLLVSFGNVIGRGVYWQVEDSKHYTNIFNLLVGDTSEGRKGLSADRVAQSMSEVDSAWSKLCVKGGLSSGEGLIWEIRDPIYKIGKDGQDEEIDPGVNDKRLLADEREFSRLLTVAKRDGNTITQIIREAWDGRGYISGGMVKHNRAAVTNPHISINGHITLTELRSQLDTVSIVNGFANRFLFTCVKRSKVLPFGGRPDPDALQVLKDRIKKVASSLFLVEREIPFDAAAHDLWDQGGVYRKLTTGRPGMLGAVCARAAPQVRRLALLYAVMDGSKLVKPAHLRAAQALWQYCEDSARFIFGDTLGEALADTLMSALRASGGMTRTQIRDLFQRNYSGDKIDAALKSLESYGMATRGEPPEGASKRGPKPEFWVPGGIIRS